MRIDVIWQSADPVMVPTWSLGQIRTAAPDPASVAAALASLGTTSDFILFWDAAFELPAAGTLGEIIDLGGDVWHAGLAAGLSGMPSFLDFVNPNWRFTRDPDPTIVATSWRLTLRACLVRTAVIRQLGGPPAAFDTLTGAGLELGHRWISNGALMRHVPQLWPGATGRPQPEFPTLTDEFRFVRARFGRRWAQWALWRAQQYGASLGDLVAAYQTAADVAPSPTRRELHSLDMPALDRAQAPTVSVLIPTLDRYPYLFKLLDQLRRQTVRPLEIIVIDQTDLTERQWNWPEQFSDLPLHVIWRDEAGQCSSRNAGLAATQGDTILFLDDDDEIEADLIERHLAFLQQYGVDGSIGVSDELGAGPLPADFRYIRDSNVLTTGNSLVRRQALLDSGLFDLAYDKGSRADGDLGMRLYLAGKLLVLNPAAKVVHLHAPRGGLRQHGARVVTSAGSGATLATRHILAPTEAYYLNRYFTPRQVEEAVLIRSVSSLSGRRRGLRRVARTLIMLALLPDTVRQDRRSLQAGRALLNHYPTIPTLASPSAKETV